MRRALALVLALLLLTVGCGSDGDEEAGEKGLKDVVKAMSCDLPDNARATLPEEVPLPAGTVAVRTIDADGVHQVRAVAPVALRALAAYLDSEWPEQGLHRGIGDREAEELETTFSAKGLRGSLIANAEGCDGTTRIVVSYSAARY